MSNLVKAVFATDTGERRLKPTTSKLFQDVFSMKENFDTTYHMGDLVKLYKIGITIGDTVCVSEMDNLHNDQAYQHAIERTKARIVEAVFGEFRQDFRMIERHLYNYEFEEAATALRSMEDKMFTTKD